MIRRQQSGCGLLPNVRMERMKQSMTLVLAFCVIASSAFANLGADSERIEDAYGTIVQRRLRDDGTVALFMLRIAISTWLRLLTNGAFGKLLARKRHRSFRKGNYEVPEGKLRCQMGAADYRHGATF